MDIINEYKDKAYITYLLCELSFNYYSTINNFCLLPTILGSSILTILNSSSIDDDILKKINISVNGLNALILALVNGYKINDRINNFKNMKIKFNLFNHSIESFISLNKFDDIKGIIDEYDRLYNDINYQFPNHIKKKIIKKYGGKKKLPNSLEIDYSENKVDMVIIKD